jgi:uroporphyrin-III C-methyltransferase
MRADRPALLAGGMDADMPVAVVCNASRQDEQCFASTLSALAEDRKDARFPSPAIIVVGRVAAHAAIKAPALAPRNGGAEAFDGYLVTRSVTQKG